MCLRRWPAGVAEGRVVEVHKGLQAIAEAAGPEFQRTLAMPRPSRQGQSVVRNQEFLFELSPWLAGVADFHRSPTVGRLGSAMAWLAEFHRAAERVGQQAGVRPGRSPGMLRRVERYQALVSGGLVKIESSLLAALENDRFAATTGVRLIEAFREAAPKFFPIMAQAAEPTLTLHLCLRDIWHDHMLFTGNEITGVVDYDALQVESPMADIARLLGSLVGDDRRLWRVGLDAYSQQRQFQHHELQVIRGLDVANCLMSGLQWLEWLYVDGRQFADLPTVHRRVEQWLERLSSLTAS